jgi:hypothetical protein
VLFITGGVGSTTGGRGSWRKFGSEKNSEAKKAAINAPEIPGIFKT